MEVAPFTEDAIEKLVKRGYDLVRVSVSTYWPGRGENNEMAERNQTVHVARAFGDADFVVAAEIPHDKRGHIDLLAFHVKSRTLVTFEAKRLYSPGGASGLAADFRRQAKFTPSKESGIARPLNRSFRVLLATTWSEDIGIWWANPNRTTAPGRRWGKGWGSLSKALGSGRAGKVDLGEGNNGKRQAGLYLIAT